MIGARLSALADKFALDANRRADVMARSSSYGEYKVRCSAIGIRVPLPAADVLWWDVVFKPLVASRPRLAAAACSAGFLVGFASAYSLLLAGVCCLLSLALVFVSFVMTMAGDFSMSAARTRLLYGSPSPQIVAVFPGARIRGSSHSLA